MSESSASAQIIEAVSAWPGVHVDPEGDLGEVAFKLGHREIGHLHGDRAAHFGFPKAVWEDLRREGRIVPHPAFPDKRGPAARRIATEDDVRDVIALLRMNYDRVVARHGVPQEQDASRP